MLSLTALYRDLASLFRKQTKVLFSSYSRDHIERQQLNKMKTM